MSIRLRRIALYVVSVITNISGSQIRQIRLWSFQLGLFRKKTSNIYNHDIDITESERYLQTSDFWLLTSDFGLQTSDIRCYISLFLLRTSHFRLKCYCDISAIISHWKHGILFRPVMLHTCVRWSCPQRKGIVL